MDSPIDTVTLSRIEASGPNWKTSAAIVWRGVDERRTVDDLAALLAAAYGIPAAAAHADTTACLKALSGQGLVFGVHGSGSETTGARS